MFKFKYHILLATFLLSMVLWVSLNLNQVYEIEKNVPVRINISKPYAVTGNIPLNLDVKYKGKGWELLRLFTSINLEFTYDITARKNEQYSILTKDYLQNKTGMLQDLNIVSVFPETLFVKVDSYEEKYVKLLPAVVIDCREGYQVIGKPVLEPDSIKIGGAAELLRNIKHINTNQQVFNNVNAGIIKNITVSDSLSNIMWHSQNEVKLTINIELTAEKEFQNVEIKVPNVPADKEVLLIPQTLSLQLKGGVNQLSAVDASKIKPYIDYSSILYDTSGSLVPKFELPEGCAVISVNPEKIQYVIKMKQ